MIDVRAVMSVPSIRRQATLPLVALFLVTAAAAVIDESLGADLARERQIRKILKRNRPSVKTIKSEDGDIIDCVDIYKQPSLDHPLLRNHTIRMKPLIRPMGLPEADASRPPIPQIWHRSGVSCPEGTVPIRRVRRSDLLAAPSLDRFGKRLVPLHGYHTMTPSSSKEEMAGARIIQTLNQPNGLSAKFTLWRPDTVLNNEYSLSSIAAGSFVDVDQNLVEAGIGINPPFYNDHQTHFYVYWTKDAGRETGCYDLQCDGFVQTSSTVVVGQAIDDYKLSKPNVSTTPRSLVMTIHMDEDKTRWWLTLEGSEVGYWPEPLFPDLKESSYLHWGGFVLNTKPGGEHTSTEMGNGRFAKEGPNWAASMSDVLGIDFYYNLESPVGVEPLYAYISKYGCYSLQPTGKSTAAPYGDSFCYGGPAGPGCDLTD